MKPMLCKTLTQQCVNRNEWYKFSFDEFYLQQEKRIFLEQCKLRCTISFEMQYQTIIDNVNSLFVLFQYFNANIFWINDCLKEKYFNFFFVINPKMGMELRKSKQSMKINTQQHPNRSFNEDKNNKLTRKNLLKCTRTKIFKQQAI